MTKAIYPEDAVPGNGSSSSLSTRTTSARSSLRRGHGFNLVGAGYDYRPTLGVWFRGLFWVQPNASLMASAPLMYQVHATAAWFLYALWPFSRVVQIWSPLQYLGCPYILYRSRYAAARR
ncbi:MAG: respiratory nitrate reductase subunit gamma [Candidatus Dormibacteraeota bacterium]|nr:respiratory nitrate reductase subunit gamma [Candidatus Dormibacteraeota bacterium]